MVCSRYPREFLYYEKVLKRKCLRKLKNNVWENKVKWKLIEKADIHLRLKLLYKYLNLWMKYLNECYKKKINRRAAESLYEEKLKSKGLLALKKNAEQSWMLLRVCKKKHEWNLKFKSWHQWKHYTQKRLKIREIKLLANKIREDRLRVKFFYLWSYRLNEKRSLQDACVVAAVKNEEKLKRKYFKSWKTFTKRRICKKEIERLSMICYRDRLLEKVFHAWKKLSFQKARYRSLVKIIQNFHETHLLENYLSRWLLTARKLKFERNVINHNLAEDFRRRKLLERSFGCLRRAMENGKTIKQKFAEFSKRYTEICVNHYLNLWLERTSAKVAINLLETKAEKWRECYLTELLLGKLLEKYQERRLEREEMKKVEKYFDAIIIHRAFRGWIEVTTRRKNRRAQAENAYEWYFEKLNRKSFKKWRRYLTSRRQKKLATAHHTKTVLTGVLNRWKTFVQERRSILTEARSLERKQNLKLMKSVFSAWKDEYQILKSLMNTAVDFYNKSKISKVFRTWRKNVQVRIINRNNCNQKLLILKNILIKETISRWHEICLGRQCLNESLEELKSRQEKRSLGFHFTAWWKFVGKVKNIRERADAFPQTRSCILLEHYFRRLLEAVDEKRSLKKKEELAGTVGERTLKRRYLRKWVSFVCWKRARILEISSPEKKEEVFEVSASGGKVSRKKPLIPSYLKTHLDYEQFQEDIQLNDETYRVTQPVNGKLPVAGEKGIFVSLDI